MSDEIRAEPAVIAALDTHAARFSIGAGIAVAVCLALFVPLGLWTGNGVIVGGGILLAVLALFMIPRALSIRRRRQRLLAGGTLVVRVSEAAIGFPAVSVEIPWSRIRGVSFVDLTADAVTARGVEVGARMNRYLGNGFERWTFLISGGSALLATMNAEARRAVTLWKAEDILVVTLVTDPLLSVDERLRLRTAVTGAASSNAVAVRAYTSASEYQLGLRRDL